MVGRRGLSKRDRRERNGRGRSRRQREESRGRSSEKWKNQKGKLGWRDGEEEELRWDEVQGIVWEELKSEKREHERD